MKLAALILIAFVSFAHAQTQKISNSSGWRAQTGEYAVFFGGNPLVESDGAGWFEDRSNLIMETADSVADSGGITREAALALGRILAKDLQNVVMNFDASDRRSPKLTITGTGILPKFAPGIPITTRWELYWGQKTNLTLCLTEPTSNFPSLEAIRFFGSVKHFQ